MNKLTENKCPFCDSTNIKKMLSMYMAEKERDVDLYHCFTCNNPFLDEEMKNGVSIII